MAPLPLWTGESFIAHIDHIATYLMIYLSQTYDVMGTILRLQIGMTFLNPLCCILAMKYANPSVLAPFSGLTLVWVVLFSSHVVGERPGSSQKVACALIVLGEVLVAIFGDHTNGEEKSVEDVVSKYKKNYQSVAISPTSISHFCCI